MAYTAIDKGSLHFNTKLYTGNGSAGHSITGVGFKPDLVWMKPRAFSENHALYDSTRGTTKRLMSNSSELQETRSNGLSAFGTDGFTVNADNGENKNSETMVAWNWKANGGTTSSNSDGSITSTVQANTTAGFSIVTFTGTGSNATVGHGLGAVAKMIILKSTSHAEQWVVGHNGMDASSPWNYYLHLQSNADRASASDRWQNTAPTSSVFSVGNESQVNGSSKTYVAYCFAEKTGFSKFGRYKGNGSSDGAFINCGFKPAYIMTRFLGSGDGYDWIIYDNKRPNSYNPTPNILEANTADAKNTSSNFDCDILSNGFKFRGTESNVNDNGADYLFMAFAEAPLVGSNNIPATAR